VDFLFWRNAELVRVLYKNKKHRNLRLREFCICNPGRLGQTSDLFIEALAEVEGKSTPARSQSKMEILTLLSGFFYEIKLGREVYAEVGAKAPNFGKLQPGHF
jgi:hypothetical protein